MKRAIIIGATYGIGNELAKILRKTEYKVDINFIHTLANN